MEWSVEVDEIVVEVLRWRTGLAGNLGSKSIHRIPSAYTATQAISAAMRQMPHINILPRSGAWLLAGCAPIRFLDAASRCAACCVVLQMYVGQTTCFSWNTLLR